MEFYCVSKFTMRTLVSTLDVNTILPSLATNTQAAYQLFQDTFDQRERGIMRDYRQRARSRENDTLSRLV